MSRGASGVGSGATLWELSLRTGKTGKTREGGLPGPYSAYPEAGVGGGLGEGLQWAGCPQPPTAPCFQSDGRKTCICNKDCKLRCIASLNNEYNGRSGLRVQQEGPVGPGTDDSMQVYRGQPLVAVNTWGPAL